MKKMNYEITIAEVENGYVARAGCKLFVFETWENLNKELTAYANGKETELTKRIKEETVEQPVCQPATVQEAPVGITDNLAKNR